MKLKGSQIIMECLKEQGIDIIFGYPGGQIMPLYDALYDYLGEIKHVLTSHEQGATHAADGYARSTGKIGVCFATSGPGATNTVTGIATAYMDSVPMIVITGQVPLSLIGKDAFQEVDITGITIPITKHNFFISSVADIAPTIRRAFQIAASGRPGPVLIDVPKNLMLEICEYEKAEPYGKLPHGDIDQTAIEEVSKLINKAKRPIIYSGGGIIISEASVELTKIAEKAQIPVSSTLMGLGSFSRRNPLSLGMVGMHGEKEANLAMHNCDLVIAIGARFSDRVTGDVNRFAQEATIIHIDVDESEISKNVKADIHIIGDIKDILTSMIPMIEKQDHKDWLQKIHNWKKEKIEDKEKFNPENIFKILNEILGDDVIVVTEVGQHQMWTAQMWPFTKPRTLISSGGLGTMGFGLGAAIGTQMANPGKRVLHIAGDGCFRMNCNELITVAAQKLPIITVVLKNNTLGMVRQWQKLFFSKRYSATDLPDIVDYVKLSEAMGLNANLAIDLDGLKDALAKAKDRKTGTVIICDIHIDENVFPIVPPGEALNNQVSSEE
ncbi:MAG: biosynthetic-type acetolactate synthase large subunit [Eubacteriales bacterium]